MLGAVLDALLPVRCAAWDVADPGGILCAEAAETLLPVEPDDGVVGEDSVQAAWAYGGALRDIIVRAKFGPDERRARALARLWRRALLAGQVARPHPGPDAPSAHFGAVTFVPAHWRRRLRRGFDLPPLLAEAVAGVLEAPVVDLLRCQRHLPPQSAATDRDERSRQAIGRYALRAEATQKLGPVLLIDDVVTTGATLAAASAVLRKAGMHVTPAALCRTPIGL